MPTAIALIKWTQQGVQGVKSTTETAKQTRAYAERAGGKLHRVYWTQGRYDVVLIIEHPDLQVLTLGLLEANCAGGMRSETLLAFNETEMEQTLSKVE